MQKSLSNWGPPLINGLYLVPLPIFNYTQSRRH